MSAPLFVWIAERLSSGTHSSSPSTRGMLTEAGAPSPVSAIFTCTSPSTSRTPLAPRSSPPEPPPNTTDRPHDRCPAETLRECIHPTLRSPVRSGDPLRFFPSLYRLSRFLDIVIPT